MQVLRNAINERPLDIENHAVKPHSDTLVYSCHWNARRASEFHKNDTKRLAHVEKLGRQAEERPRRDEAALPWRPGAFGLPIPGLFSRRFSTLSSPATYLSLSGLALMVVSIALLVAPVMQHRLVEGGHASRRLLRTTTVFAAASLVPLGLSLALATYVVIGRRYGMTAGVTSGLIMGGT